MSKEPSLSSLAHPVTKPRLTVEQVEVMLAHIFRLPDVFALARERLRPELFNAATEPHYNLLWQTAKQIVDKETPKVLFEQLEHAYTLLEVTASAQVRAMPAQITAEYCAKLFNRNPEEPGLLHWIYHLVDTAELTFFWGRELLRDFCLEREVHDTLRRTLSRAGESTLADMPGFLRQLHERHTAISAIEHDPVESAAPDGWWPTSMKKFPTNIPFLDPFLRGGHAGKEVYGVLGAYASGKTSLAVQLAAKGALYQLALSRQCPGYQPKEWYVFSYEATKDELRIRLWSQECTIMHDHLEEFDASHLSSIENGYDSLYPYEKRYWAEQLKLNPQMTIKGERERLEFLATFRDNPNFVDMTGADNPNLGSGYVPEIASVVQNNLRNKSQRSGRPHEVGGLVIDYAGLCAHRFIEAQGLDYSELRHLIGKFGYQCKRQLAIPFDCPVWVFHQLSAAANKRTHLVKQQYYDAAEAGNFAENVVFCFALGTKDPVYGAFYLTCSKARRAGLGPAPLLAIEGDFFRLVSATHVALGIDGKFWPREDCDTVTKTPAITAPALKPPPESTLPLDPFSL